MPSRRLTFFADENISHSLAYMLNEFDRNHEIRASRDYFNSGIPDTEWIPEVASWDNPVALCGDGRILHNAVERKCLKEHGLMFVFLVSGWMNIKWEDFAWKIIRAWPNIVRNVEQARYPMLFEVSVNGKVRPRQRISNL